MTTQKSGLCYEEGDKEGIKEREKKEKEVQMDSKGIKEYESKKEENYDKKKEPLPILWHVASFNIMYCFSIILFLLYT